MSSAAERAATFDIQLLGPVRVLRDGQLLDLGGTRAETLLALLALRAGAPVSPDSLAEDLWSGDPPDGAAITLRSYVSRLRTALGDALPIERSTAGYALVAPPGAIDMPRFEADVRAGRELLERGRHGRAATVLRRALSLWRGAPFDGLALDGSLAAEAVRLEELRLHALESAIEAELATGLAAELVDELEAAVAAHPFRESLWRQLMLALYRAGRQADALAAYHRARSALDEQLGIEPGEELRALEAAILRQEVPSSPSARPAGTALPVALTSFIGRDREVEDVLTLLRRGRLVTLVGVGGVGKTRLALETARRAVGDLADGVAFADLATASDPELLPSLVGAAVGIRERAGQPLTATIADHLRSVDVLLVLDNCEHLRDGVAVLVQTLLTASPELRILATSREVLDVAGEAAYPVAPLALPRTDDGPDALRDSDAVRLLLERAQLSRHDLRVDDAALAVAARICRELDGLPLAIELAAARAKALSLDEIAERLTDRFQFLVAWRRVTTARHRTLREAMDWSFELLGPEEQDLLTKLSVFPSGASLASVAEVCLDGVAGEAERRIERLVDASLVVPIDGPHGTRYRLLETVRQYGAARLAEADAEGLRRRHAERVRAIAVSTNLGLERTGSTMSFDLAREELPSVRAAVRWAVMADPELGLDIACGLERLWVTSHAREGIAMFTELLAGSGVSDLARARGLRCRGGCSYVLGEYHAGTADYEAALELHRRNGQRKHAAHLLMRLAAERYRAGDPDGTLALLDEAAAAGGDDRFPVDRYATLGMLAELAVDAGRPEEGFELFHQESSLAAEVGDSWWRMNAELRLADRAHQAGHVDMAGRAARTSIRLALEVRSRLDLVWSIGLVALEAAALGDGRRAGRLWGGLEAEVERGGPVGQWEDEADALRARAAALAGMPFEPGVAEGRRLSLEAVVAEALEPS